MPTRQGKKKDSGNRNPNRRNGKAFKKHPQPQGPRKRTEERQHKDEAIRLRRSETHIRNKIRREEEARLAAELAEEVATEVAQKVAEENARNAARVALKKVHRAHVVA